MKLLIATTLRPETQEKATAAFTALREFAKDQNGEITSGMLWTPGPGCSNLAFEFTSPDEEKFADILTMGLMPAKWCTTKDDMPAEDTWNF